MSIKFVNVGATANAASGNISPALPTEVGPDDALYLCVTGTELRRSWRWLWLRRRPKLVHTVNLLDT